MSGYVSVSMRQLVEARVSRAHMAAIRATGAVPRQHMHILDHVPVGLVRKALRFRRARRRALILSGQTLQPRGAYMRRRAMATTRRAYMRVFKMLGIS